MNKKWMIALMIGASAAVAWAQKAPLDIVKSVQATNQVEFKTTLGDFTIEVYSDNAPKTVQNFLQYVKSGHYNGTIFHRVIGNFMVQGGGFTSDMIHKDTRAPIPLEANNGLRNDRGSVAMARTSDPNSATSQFFINLADNNSLNGTSVIKGTGYAVFGKIIAGMETIDKIRNVPTKNEGKFQDVPVTPIVILSATSDAPLAAGQTDIQPLTKPETSDRSSPLIPPLISDTRISAPSCGDNGDGTVTGVDGSIWQLCLIGQTYEGGSCAGLAKDLKWMDAMYSAESNRFQGKSDWALPSASLFDKSFSIKNCSHPNVRKWSVEYEWARPVDKVKMTGIFWTSTMESDALVRVMDDSYVYSKNVVFLDTNKDASSGERYYQNVRAVLVRNVPESAKGDYYRALKFFQDCAKNSKCRSARVKQQQEVDRQSIADFQERWKNLGRQVGAAMSSNSSSSDSTGSNWTIESTRKVAAVSWHAETYVRCTGARNKGQTFNILHLDTGRYQSVTGPTETTIKKVADFHCN